MYSYHILVFRLNYILVFRLDWYILEFRLIFFWYILVFRLNNRLFWFRAGALDAALDGQPVRGSLDDAEPSRA